VPPHFEKGSATHALVVRAYFDLPTAGTESQGFFHLLRQCLERQTSLHIVGKRKMLKTVDFCRLYTETPEQGCMTEALPPAL